MCLEPNTRFPLSTTFCAGFRGRRHVICVALHVSGRRWFVATVACLPFLLIACGGNGSDGSTAVTMNGTVQTGAAGISGPREATGLPASQVEKELLQLLDTLEDPPSDLSSPRPGATVDSILRIQYYGVGPELFEDYEYYHSERFSINICVGHLRWVVPPDRLNVRDSSGTADRRWASGFPLQDTISTKHKALLWAFALALVKQKSPNLTSEERTQCIGAIAAYRSFAAATPTPNQKWPSIMPEDAVLVSLWVRIQDPDFQAAIHWGTSFDSRGRQQTFRCVFDSLHPESTFYDPHLQRSLEQLVSGEASH